MVADDIKAEGNPEGYSDNCLRGEIDRLLSYPSLLSSQVLVLFRFLFF